MSRTVIRAAVIATITLCAASRVQAQPGVALPADLAAVPADAIMFAHIRAAELWRSEPFKEFRTLVDRAGPRALETYTRRFPISPALIDRVTLFGIPGPADRPQAVPPPLVVVSLNKPIDQARLVAFLMPNARASTVGSAGIFVGADNNMCLYVIDQQTIIISSPESVKAYLSRARTSSGPMLMAKERALKHHLTVAINVAALPPEATQQIPPPLQPLAKASLAGLTVDVGAEISIEAGLRYADSESAIAAEKAARDGIAMARQKLQEARKEVGKPLLEPTTPAPAPLRELPEALASLGGLAMFGVYDELLEKFPLSRESSNLVVRVKLPAHAVPTLPLAAVGVAAYFGFATQRQLAVPPRPISTPPLLDKP